MSDHSPQLCTSASFPHEIDEEWGLNLLAAHPLCKDEHFPLGKKKKPTEIKNLIEKTASYMIQDCKSGMMCLAADCLACPTCCCLAYNRDQIQTCKPYQALKLFPTSHLDQISCYQIRLITKRIESQCTRNCKNGLYINIKQPILTISQLSSIR